MASHPISLFVYGTLLSPRVCQVVLNRVPEGSDAILRDFSRYRLQDRFYPAIREEAGGVIRGRVLRISEKELQDFDTFEGDEYQRQEVEVARVDDGSLVLAYAYVALDFLHQDMDGEWDFEKFEREDLEAFIESEQEGLPDVVD